MSAAIDHSCRHKLNIINRDLRLTARTWILKRRRVTKVTLSRTFVKSRKKSQRSHYTMSSYCVIGPELPCTDHVTSCFYGGADGVNFKDRAGRTALHTAVSKGRSRVVEKLLRRGADSNIIDNEGYTPLHLAVMNCRVDLVRLLLRFDADCNVSSNSLSPFSLAVKILSETLSEFDPISMTYSATVIKGPPTSRKPVFGYDDFSSPVVIVNNVNEYKDFTQDYFAKYITRGLLHISFTLLYYGCEITSTVISPQRCCHLLEKAITTVTQPHRNASVYTDLQTLSVSIERLSKNGCSLPSDFSTSASKFRDYQENERRKRIMKLFILLLKDDRVITELAHIVCQKQDEEMVKYMSACGHRNAVEAAQKKWAFPDELLATIRAPSSLLDLCRINIRKNLSVNQHGCSDFNIDNLSLPKTLKRYLSFCDWNEPFEHAAYKY